MFYLPLSCIVLLNPMLFLTPCFLFTFILYSSSQSNVISYPLCSVYLYLVYFFSIQCYFLPLVFCLPLSCIVLLNPICYFLPIVLCLLSCIFLLDPLYYFFLALMFSLSLSCIFSTSTLLFHTTFVLFLFHSVPSLLALMNHHPGFSNGVWAVSTYLPHFVCDIL